ALERGAKLLLPESEEAFLIWPDLMKADVVEAGVHAIAHRFHVRLHVGSDRSVFGRLLEGDVLDRRLEIRRPTKLLCQLPAERAGRPQLVREPARGGRVAAPADLHLDVLRLPLAARALVLRDKLVVRVRRDETIAGARRELGRLRPAGRDVDRRGRLADRVQARVRHGEVATAKTALAASEQRTHQVDRLLEHLATDLKRWPAAADDVLVQVLAGPDAEEEASFEHDVRRRRGLGDDRRVYADDRARDAGAHGELRRRGDPTDDRPDERALALPVDPRVEVIGELDVRETGRLCALGG